MDSQIFMSLLAGPVSAAFVSGGVAIWTARQSRKAKKSLEAQKNKYAEELAAQQNEYTKQIEALKTQLAFSLARKSKFAEKEFEVLAKCWAKIVKLRLSVIHEEHNLIQICRDTFINNGKLNELSQFTEAQCKERLSTGVYKETINAEDIKYIAAQPNEKRVRLTIHYKYMYYENIFKKNRDDFAVYFEHHKIFISPNIQGKFWSIFSGYNVIHSELEKLAFKLCDFKIGDKEIVDYMKIADKSVPVLFEKMDDIFWELERIISKKLFSEEIEPSEKRA